MLDKNLLALPGARVAFGLLLAFSFVDAVLVALQSAVLAWVLTLLWGGAALGEAALFVAAFAGVYVVRHAIGYARSAFLDRFSCKTASDLREQVLHATYARGVAGVQAAGTGSSAAMVVEGVDAVRTYVGSFPPKVTDLVMIPAVLTLVLFGFDWVSGLIALVILPCIVAYMRLLGSHAKAQAASQYAEYTVLSNHFIDTLRGMPTLKAFGRSKPYSKQVFAVSERFREATIKTIRAATLSSLVLDLFRTFALAAVAIMLGLRLLDGSMGLFPALVVLLIVPEYFAAVRRYSTDFHASLDGRNNLKGIVDAIAAAQGEGVVATALDEALADVGGDLSLALRDVAFAYNDEEGAALQGVDLAFPAGSRVGVVGVSGSGKSTLARLVAGFASPTAGCFEVNGVSVSTLADPAWLSHVTYIPQDPYLFSDTLRNNIAFYVTDATDEAVERAVRAAGLESLVTRLPEGLDTMIGAGGRQLSGGQAQRVALARAFLDESRRVLVFDEPTAHLDIQTELELKRDMLALMEGRLVFFATHRLHWVGDMDYVVVLDGGRVVEAGTPDELAAAGGAFVRLTAQMRAGDVA